MRVTAALAAAAAIPNAITQQAALAGAVVPMGFRLPTACSFVGSASQIGPGVFTWQVDCGPATRSARTVLGPALAAQGWAFCSSGLGTGAAIKGGLLTSVAESTGRPGEHARLTQWPIPPHGCGQLKTPSR